MTVDRSRPSRVPFLAAFRLPALSAPEASWPMSRGARRDGARAAQGAPKRGSAGAVAVRRVGLALVLSALTVPVLAQAPAPSAAASAAPGEAWSTERSRRDADKVLQWIKLHADLPRTRAKDGATAPKRPADADAPRSAKPAGPATPATAAAASGGTSVATPAAAAPAPGTPPTAARAADAPATAARVEATTPVAPRAEPVPATAVAATAAPAGAMAVPASPPRAGAPAPEPVEEAPEALVPLEQAPPAFQRRLMEQLRKGNVEVRLTVAPDGQVSDVQVLNSTHPRLQAPVVAAVRQWRFKPLRAPQSASVELGFDIDREL